MLPKPANTTALIALALKEAAVFAGYLVLSHDDILVMIELFVHVFKTVQKVIFDGADTCLSCFTLVLAS